MNEQRATGEEPCADARERANAEDVRAVYRFRATTRGGGEHVITSGQRGDGMAGHACLCDWRLEASSVYEAPNIAQAAPWWPVRTAARARAQENANAKSAEIADEHLASVGARSDRSFRPEAA